MSSYSGGGNVGNQTWSKIIHLKGDFLIVINGIKKGDLNPWHLKTYV